MLKTNIKTEYFTDATALQGMFLYNFSALFFHLTITSGGSTLKAAIHSITHCAVIGSIPVSSLA